MKTFFCFLFFSACVFLNTKSQNLVPNYSFENITFCNAGGGRIYEAVPWFQPCTFAGNTTNSSSSDLFDTCALPGDVGIPWNVGGYQFARTGHGYSGIAMSLDTSNYREYLEVPLVDTLITNNMYCVEFYASLADSSVEAISNIGAYFSNDSLLDNSHNHTVFYVNPQVENSITNILVDKINWMQIRGNFIAHGGERFMTIGNFHNPTNTNSINVGGSTQNYSYYYIDDISVTRCNVGIDEVKAEARLEVYPNPTTNEIRIITTERGIKKMKINNMLGECVYEHNVENEKKEISVDVSGLLNGMYFVEVMFENKIYNAKFIKQ